MVREENVSNQGQGHLPSKLTEYMGSCIYTAYITNESAKCQVSMGLFCAHYRQLGNLALSAGEKWGPRSRSEGD